MSPAVHLLEKAANLGQVSRQLGHSSPPTTANMYADVGLDDIQGGVRGPYSG
jgi:integrase